MGSASSPDGPGPALAALRERADGEVRSVVRFDRTGFELLFVSDSIRAKFDGEEAIRSHFARLYEYVSLDYTEQALFVEEFVTDAGTIRYMTSAFEKLKLLRVYDGPRGVLLTLDPDEPVVPLVGIVESRLL